MEDFIKIKASEFSIDEDILKIIIDDYHNRLLHRNRNILTYITNLITVVSDDRLSDRKLEAIKHAKEGVNYLAERDVYKDK